MQADLAAEIEWIAADWGTTHLRVWAMAGGKVRAVATSDEGMRGLSGPGYEPALLRLIAPWLGDRTRQKAPLPVIACGMVGARQGWIEAPYAAVPCAPMANRLAPAPVRDARIAVWIVPGLCQQTPPDVMRGEETQIAGFLAAHPDFEGTLCLPGTHSKWVRIASGKVQGFRTCMTGEVFDLLSRTSVLRHSLGDGAQPGWDGAAFAAAVARGIETPSMLLADLFSIRARGLLHRDDPAQARATLSGVLIAGELAAMRADWTDREVVLIGDEALCAVYSAALETQGIAARAMAAAAMTQAGLTFAHRIVTEDCP